MSTPESFHDGRAVLYAGDSREVLRQLPDASIDAVVCDPPYGLGREPDPAAMLRAWLAGEAYTPKGAGFMGKAWDSFVPGPEIWRECLRVLKPGGHLLAFFSTRTHDLGTLAIRLAGFEIRDAIWDVIASDSYVQGFMASLSVEQRLAFARCVEESQFGGALAWIYASGFPKSHDVARAIDALDGLEMRRDRALQFTAWMRSTGISSGEVNRLTDSNMASHYLTAGAQPEVATAEMFDRLRPHLPPVPPEIEALVAARTVESENLKRRRVVGHHEDQAHAAKWRESYDGSAAAEAKPITQAYTEAARAWEGWGTALKPALEPITVARKPLSGTVGENVRAHGTGALNIDGCRIGNEGGTRGCDAGPSAGILGDGLNGARGTPVPGLGRWPANVVHDGSAEVETVFAAFGESVSRGGTVTRRSDFEGIAGNKGGAFAQAAGKIWEVPADAGTAARFFFSAKADAEDRLGSKHPTVKPVDLMQWLIRLVASPKVSELVCEACNVPPSDSSGGIHVREDLPAVSDALSVASECDDILLRDVSTRGASHTASPVQVLREDDGSRSTAVLLAEVPCGEHEGAANVDASTLSALRCDVQAEEGRRPGVLQPNMCGGRDGAGEAEEVAHSSWIHCAARSGEPDGDQAGLCHGASADHGGAPGATAAEGRGGPSHQWDQGRQQDRELAGHVEGGSRPSAKACHDVGDPVSVLQGKPETVKHCAKCGGRLTWRERASVILDPFAGSGTTGEAALREGMRAVLVEREAEYRADIARRLQLTFAGPAIRKAERVKARGKAEAPAPLFDLG